MADDLEARLESHAQAFEGLLSLIPAKDYFAQDNSDQWTRKKQTKEQKRAAKRAKLNPENQKSAKDVMDENERKRKRELGIDSDNEDNDDDAAESDMDVDVEKEVPGEGSRKNKKQKVDTSATTTNDGDDAAVRAARAAEKRKEKRQLKKEKVEKTKQKKEAKISRKQDQDLDDLEAERVNGDDAESDDDEEAVPTSNDVDAMDFSGLVDDDEPTSTTTPDQDSSIPQSADSSSSSVAPPTSSSTSTTDPKIQKPKKELALKLPSVDAEELQSRLRTRIEELRARRKADLPNGQARNRQELLETRRKREETRKAHKKEQRLKAKQDEERLNNERLRGSGSPLATDIFSPRIVDENNFSFGRVAFEDGQEADAKLTTINDHKKKKGPQDTRSALQAAEKKAQRLAGFDESKRADIEEKDLWLNAKKKAHGERLRDDQNLLKKALKREQKVKTKSATEWNERSDNVRKGKEMKDKRREENLMKRRDDKGTKKGKKGGAAQKKGGAKKRPGFEGRFKQ